jgi:hypothetical protein
MPTQPQQLGPFCQSCAMPLQQPSDFGTEASGFRQNDYCHFCYQNGALVNPDMTMPEMLDLSVSMMVKYGVMPEPEARGLLTQVMPMLKRWRVLAATA